MKIIIFDPETTGHHPSYIEYLIRGWESLNLQGTLIVLIAPDFLAKFPHLTDLESEASENSFKIIFKPISSSHYESYQKAARPSVKSWIAFNYLLQEAKIERPDHIFIPSIDYYLLPLCLSWKSKNLRCMVSGIVFTLSSHYHSKFKSPLSFKLGLRTRIFGIAIKICSYRGLLEAIFSLDSDALPLISRLCPELPAKHCPDPVDTDAANSAKPIDKSQLGISLNRKVLLTMGQLQREKGVWSSPTELVHRYS